MKYLILATILGITALFVLSSLPPPDEVRVEAEKEFQPQSVEDGMRVAFAYRAVSLGATLVTLGFYTWLVFSGRARRLTDTVDRWTGGRWWLTLFLVVAVCFFAERLLRLPFAVAGNFVTLSWGLTSRSWLSWLIDYGKTVGLMAGIGIAAVFVLYILVRLSPRRWWLPASISSVVISFAFAYVLPLWIEPLFNTFESLQSSNPKLAAKIRTLTERAGIPVHDVLVKDASRQSNFTNAYFTGFGPSRRIVLYDNLIKNHPADEIVNIVAHEIGHWQYHHITMGITLGALGVLLGFLALSRILLWAVAKPPFQLKSPADPAGWPLIVLLFLIVSWIMLPVENAISRQFEWQADWASLELMDAPPDKAVAAFIRAEKRMARDNKINVAPAPVSVWMFFTHPPTLERIRMARQWHKQRLQGSY